MITTLFIALVTLYAVILALRATLAMGYIRRSAAAPTMPENEAGVTVLQPILGGDPRLAACLAENLRNAPRARFVWLLDEDDANGRAAAAGALRESGRGDVRQLFTGPPPPHLNPKVFKLLRGSEAVATHWLAVLDDDTVLPPGTLGRAMAMAQPDCLVTALPVYRARLTPWSRLVTGFVNGNAVLTYPPMAWLGASRTINGMFVVMRRADLASRDGFAPILAHVTDDYALARLFLDRRGCIVQTCLWHPIETTVTGAGAYFRLMRRWMVFGRIYALENRDPATLLLVVLPGLLPLPLICLGALLGPGALALALVLLALKAGAAWWLTARLCGEAAPRGDLAYMVAADILLPIHMVAALIRPRRIRWRGRELRLRGSRIARR